MRGRKILLVTVACATIAAVTLSLLRYNTDQGPVINGRPLAYWVLAHYDTTGSPDAAEQAIKTAGTNALPFLLKSINYEPPRWRQSLRRLQLRLTLQTWRLDDRRSHLAFAACEAFAYLGTSATSAIPELTRLASQPSRPLASRHAVSALVAIGTNAIPALIEIAGNPKLPRRYEVLFSIWRSGDQVSNFIPAIKVFLENPDRRIRSTATNILREFAPEPLPPDQRQGQIGIPKD